MSIVDQKILENEAFSISEIASILGAASTDLGTLCTHDNINVLSRIKPINNTTIVGELNEEERHKLNFGVYVPPVEFDGNGSPKPTKAWSHIKPTKIYRMSDFKGYTHKRVAPIQILFGGDFGKPSQPNWKNASYNNAFVRCGIALDLNRNRDCVSLRDVTYTKTTGSVYQSNAFDNLYLWFCIANGSKSYCKRTTSTIGEIMKKSSGIEFVDFYIVDGLGVDRVEHKADFNGELKNISGDYTFVVFAGEGMGGITSFSGASHIEGAMSLNAINDCDKFILNYTVSAWQDYLKVSYSPTLTYISTSNGYRKYRLSNANLVLERETTTSFVTENFAYKVELRNYTYGNDGKLGYIATSGKTNVLVKDASSITLASGDKKTILIELNNSTYDLYVPDGSYGTIQVTVNGASNATASSGEWRTLLNFSITKQFND